MKKMFFLGTIVMVLIIFFTGGLLNKRLTNWIKDGYTADSEYKLNYLKDKPPDGGTRFMRGLVVWSGPGDNVTPVLSELAYPCTIMSAVGMPYDVASASDVVNIDLAGYDIIALSADKCAAENITAVRSGIEQWVHQGGILLTWRFPLSVYSDGTLSENNWAMSIQGVVGSSWCGEETLFKYNDNEYINIPGPDNVLLKLSGYDMPTLDSGKLLFEAARAHSPSSMASKGGLWVSRIGNGLTINTETVVTNWCRHDTTVIELYLRTIRHFLPGWVIPLPKTAMSIRVDADGGEKEMPAAVDYLSKKDLPAVGWFVVTSAVSGKLPANFPAAWEIGSHSVTHPYYMERLTAEQVLAELDNSKRDLERMYKTNVAAFALPGSGSGWYHPDSKVRFVNKSRGIYSAIGVNSANNADECWQDGECTVVGTPIGDFSSTDNATKFDAGSGEIYDTDKSKWLECWGSSGFLLTPSFHDYILSNADKHGWYDDRIQYLKSLNVIWMNYGEYAKKRRSWLSNGIRVSKLDRTIYVDVVKYEPLLTVALPDPGDKNVVVRTMDGTSLPVDLSKDPQGNLLLTLR